MAELLNIHEVNTRELEERTTRFHTDKFKKIKHKTFCKIIITEHAKERAMERLETSDLSQVIKALYKRNEKGQFIVFKQKDKEHYYTKGTVDNKQIWVCGKWSGLNFVITTIIPRIKGQMKGVR